jgi:hypothetical protein
MNEENKKEHDEQSRLDEAKGEQPQKEPSEFVCKFCGHNQFGHISEGMFDYSYCQKCFTNYDEEGNIIPEGDENLPEFDPDDPDKERDIKEA